MTDLLCLSGITALFLLTGVLIVFCDRLADKAGGGER